MLEISKQEGKLALQIEARTTQQTWKKEHNAK